ncbi:MAG: 3-oxo-tetronate kinase [Lachnospiraceae bacterium]
MEKAIVLGCIADDFTGASDAASFLEKGGMKVMLINGIPGEAVSAAGFEAVVIALKTRTQETGSAVADSLKAAAWLKEQGASQLYLKYCSTFDSTRTGNIGPIADALLESCGIPYTILCPALPVNKRTVKDGCLYVDGILLHESSMKNHPLTPMWDADIEKLMQPQSKYPCFKANTAMLKLPTAEIHHKLAKFGAEHKHFYVIPDYVDDSDAEKIVEVFGGLPLLTGGSGVLEALGKKHASGLRQQEAAMSHTAGNGLILAGSCSQATLGQIKHYIGDGGKAIRMNPQELLEGKQTVETLWAEMSAFAGETVLIYSSDEAREVRKIQAEGLEKVSSLLEGTTAELAKRAVAAGYFRIIVAGGETSGAVTKKLGFEAYQIGESVAPGVPVMIPINNRDIRLVLKSGNFGQEDFFTRALKITGKERGNDA